MTTKYQMAEATEKDAAEFKKTVEGLLLEAKTEAYRARLAVLAEGGNSDCDEAWWIRAWLACAAET